MDFSLIRKKNSFLIMYFPFQWISTSSARNKRYYLFSDCWEYEDYDNFEDDIHSYDSNKEEIKILMPGILA